MEHGALAGFLARLGLSADAAAVYLALLDRPPGPLSALAADAGLGEWVLLDAYEQLVEAGLASAAGDGDGLVTPVPPAAGLEILGRRRAVELDDARIAVTRAFESFRRHRLSQYTDNLVEVITGESIVWRIRHAMGSVHTEIRRFDSPPYFINAATNAEEELAQLSRGIRHRTVYSRASLEHPGYVAVNIEACVHAGEQARILPSLPVKLTIIDDSYALLSLSIVEAEANNALLIVRPCGLLSALTALFELCWQTAPPFYGSETGPLRLQSADRRMLSLLAAGLTDEQIARQLGVSRRTFFRRLGLLMARLGATSRFQLALQAERRGWV